MKCARAAVAHDQVAGARLPVGPEGAAPPTVPRVRLRGFSAGLKRRAAVGVVPIGVGKVGHGAAVAAVVDLKSLLDVGLHRHVHSPAEPVRVAVGVAHRRVSPDSIANLHVLLEVGEMKTVKNLFCKSKSFVGMKICVAFDFWVVSKAR